MTPAKLQHRLLQALLPVILFSGLAVAQDYEIKLSRPVTVGDRFRLVASGRNVENMTVLAGQRILQQKADEIEIDFIAVLTVLEVDGRGKPTRYSVEIEKIAATPNGSVSGALIPGTVVIAGIEGQRYIFSVNGVPLDALSSKVLSIILPSYRTDVSDDEVFGTSERKKVGESWPINAEVAARSLNETFKISVDRRDLSGRSSLDGIVKQGSAEYLIIGANLRVDNFSVPLPNGFRFQSSQIEGTFSGRFPVNPGRPPLNQFVKMSAKFIGARSADPETPELTITGNLEQSVRREFQALP